MAEVRRYRPKLSEVLAIKWNKSNIEQIKEFCEGTEYVADFNSYQICISKGRVLLSSGVGGCYIVKDLKGRVWIESKREFEAAFELVKY